MVHSVLIVEDDQGWRELLSKILTTAGYSCIPAQDYDAGEKMLIEQKPSVLVLDLQLRRWQRNSSKFLGWKLAKLALKSRVPVIVATGHGSVPLANDAFREHKVIAFLEKSPFDRAKLIEAVAEGMEEFRYRKMSDEEVSKCVEKMRAIFWGGKEISKGAKKP